MPWRSPRSLRSKPGAAARQAPFAGGRLLTVMMLRGYYRPEAATGHTIRIAVIRAQRYATDLHAKSVVSTRRAVGCCFSCLVILCFAQSSLLNSDLQNTLSGIPMLRGTTVARKQS